MSRTRFTQVTRRLGSRWLFFSTFVLAVACSDRAPTAPNRGLPNVIPSSQPSRIQVSGRVTDSVTGAPIENARVEWVQGVTATWGEGAVVFTDTNGHYEFAADPTVFLPIRVDKDGYSTAATSVPSGEIGSPVNFALRPLAGNGTVTWMSISSPGRTICAEITNRLGSTYPLWLIANFSGNNVNLRLSHEPPDPMQDPPPVFVGTRTGEQITANLTGPFGEGLACPGDDSMTPQTGGTLSGRIAGNVIEGDYTEVYGIGPSEVVFLFHFRATLRLP